jgi:hypothetical protein
MMLNWNIMYSRTAKAGSGHDESGSSLAVAAVRKEEVGLLNLDHRQRLPA